MPKSTPYWIEPALWQMSVISMIGVVLMYTGIGEASVVMVLLGFGSFTILTILGKVMYGYNLKARTAMLANMAVISALHLAGAWTIGSSESLATQLTVLIIYYVVLFLYLIASIVIVVKLSDVFAPSGFSSRDAFLGVATSTLLIYSIFGSIYFCVYYISLGFTILSLLMSSAVFWIPRIHVAQPVEIKEEYISA